MINESLAVTRAGWPNFSSLFENLASPRQNMSAPQPTISNTEIRVSARSNANGARKSAFFRFQAMLDTLRVAELQELLAQARLTRSGRKQQLIDRLSNHLIMSSAPELVEAIKFKFEARVGNRSAPRRFRGDHAPPPPPPPPSSPTKKAKGSETSCVPIDVRFRSLAFFHQCDVIIRPSLLRTTKREMTR